MKNIRKIMLVVILPVFVVSCSTMQQINFGEIGLRLPFDSDDSSLTYKVCVDGLNVDYSKEICGKSGDTFIIDDLDSGKYQVSYSAYNSTSGAEVYSGKTSAKVYVGIISPVRIELE